MKKSISILLIVIMILSLCACSGNSNNHDGEAKTPSGSIIQKGRNYQDVIVSFEEKGFTNVKSVKIEDLITGWLTKDGEVESVSVDGNTSYPSDKWYPNNVEVVINYHTFPSNENDDTDVEQSTEQSFKTTDKENLLNEKFPVEYAMRAITVAFTNRYALDIFTSDGNNIDTSKFHTYSDTGGDPSKYFMYVTDVGEWTAVNDNTWKVRNMTLKNYAFNSLIDIMADVSYDGKNYTISRLSGTAPSYNDISLFEDEGDFSLYFVIPFKLVADDRNINEVNALDHSNELKENIAQKAFELYGKELYPYGFKCHWYTGLIAHEQDHDGSWFFKVEVTITNQYGTERKTVAESKINNGTESIEGFFVH